MGKSDRPEKSSSDKVRKSNEKEPSKHKSSKQEAKSTKKSSSTKPEASSKVSKKESSHREKEGSSRREGTKESKSKLSSKGTKDPTAELEELEAEEAAALKKATQEKKVQEGKGSAKKEDRAPPASSKYLPEPQLILRSRSRSPARRRGNAAPAVQPPLSALAADEKSCSARSSSASADGSEARRRVLQKRDDAGLRPASGFSMSADASFGGALAPLPEKIRGLLNNTDVLSQDVAILKQAVEHNRGGGVKEETEEEKQTIIKMQSRLHESLLHPDNLPRLLALTGLESVRLNSEGLVVLKAQSKKALNKALGQLRRLAYHCQWGCNHAKVSGLLAAKPPKSIHTMVVRLAATTSKLASHEARLTTTTRKLRIGTQGGIGQFVIEGIPGVSRKHCTVTFEPDKGAVYVQDLSTNGTYLNSKRLPRPPYKNPTDARVRVFHGDELFFRLRTEESEELGFIVNLYPLS